MGGVSLRGARVLVAGASTGIGNAIAREAVRYGAHTVAMLARRDMTEAAAALQTDETRVLPISVDLADTEASARAMTRVREEMGTPDVIVLSSASGAHWCIEEVTPADFKSAMASCVFASFHVVNAFIEDLLRRNSGSIVFVGSSAYVMTMPFESYMTRVAALHGFYRSLRTDLSYDKDNRVNLLWCEPPYVIDNSYLDNNQDSRTRGPLGIDPDKMGMTSDEIGRHIAAAIERGDREWRPRWLSVMLFLFRFTPLSLLINRMLFRFLPPEEGGPPCGHRARLLRGKAP
jgi:NAD(P)-dependent dehydrogenase (short-subunit alcohol dehydrogenase family)